MRSIKSAWEAVFEEYVGSIEESAIIAVPSITQPPAARLASMLGSRSREVRLDVLTNLDRASLVNGSQDVGALVGLCRQMPGTTVRHLPGLHAKAYVADRHTAIVTSANLMQDGLAGNYELGAVIDDPADVAEIADALTEYGNLGSIVPPDALRELEVKVAEAREQQGAVARSTSDAVQADIDVVLTDIDEWLRLQRAIDSNSTTAMFAHAVQYILRKHGPLSTRDIYPIVQSLFPDMCDDSVHRVINGISFGQRWKHRVRSAQVKLRRDGFIVREGNRWKLVMTASSRALADTEEQASRYAGGSWRLPAVNIARDLGRQAPDWLAEAEAAFAAGANMAGSRCLWEATRAAIAALAIRRGLAWEREQDMFRLMVQLDQEAGGGYTYLGRFGVAQSFRDNAEGVLHWEDWEFEYCRPAVERLVADLTEMAQSISVDNSGRGNNGN